MKQIVDLNISSIVIELEFYCDKDLVCDVHQEYQSEHLLQSRDNIG